MQFLRIAAVLSLVAAGETEVRAEWFSINNAISQAVLTNPGVGEASANRRATEAELRQTQGTLLPQVRLESRLGPEKFDQQIIRPPFLDQDFQDDTAFQTLYDLDLARRDDPAIAALDLVEHGKMRPDDPRDHQRNDRRQENPRCDWCGKF
jgi:hypothetical protein